MLASGLAFLFLTIIFLQTRILISKKQWKELLVYLTLFGLGILYSYGYIYDLPLLNPTKSLEKIFVPTWDMIRNILF